MANKKTRDEILYEQQFGDIPNDQLGRIAYILGKRVNNEKLNADIQKTGKKIRRIKTHKIEFTMWTIVKPSARPRANTRAGYIHMYVPRAQENAMWFEKFAMENDLPHVNTPCKLNIRHFEKTPSSFNMKQKVLGELGLLRPTRRTGDFDNFAKSIADMLQANKIFLEDDCLVYESHIELFYSIKPHVDIVVEYLEENPFVVSKV